MNIFNDYIILFTRVAQPFNPIDIFLSNRLKSRFIHSEIHFSKLVPLKKEHEDRRFFSSRGRVRNVLPKKKGVEFADVNKFIGRWIATPLSRIDSIEKALKVYDRCLEIEHLGYDSLGAIMNAGFRFPCIDVKDKFWCSEAVACVLRDYYDKFRDDNVRPETILKIVKKYNFEDYVINSI